MRIGNLKKKTNEHEQYVYIYETLTEPKNINNLWKTETDREIFDKN